MGPKVDFTAEGNKINVTVDGQQFTSYLFDKSLPKPVLYPVRTPSGIVVTRGYPLEPVEGESRDHPHHCGVFFTYDDVNGQGFWNNTGTSPQIKHIKTLKLKPGYGRGKLSTLMEWVGTDGRVLLEEHRDMVFIARPNEYAIDFNINLKAVDEKVLFGDTKEGMFAIRVAGWLKEKGGTGRYLNSNGEENEKNIWGKRARWVRLQGEKDGKVVGIAIFNHPSSVNYPTYWHARGYGLFSANPLGQYDFEKKRNPEKAKPLNYTLEPGQVAHFGFRMLIYEGPRTPEQLEQQFKDFANSR